MNWDAIQWIIGGLAVLVQALIAALLSRLWKQVDNHDRAISALGEKVSAIEVNMVASHPTKSELTTVVQQLEDRMQTGFADMKYDIRDLKSTVGKIFDKLEDKQDKR